MGKTAAVVLAWLWNRVGHPEQNHRDRWPRRLVYCLAMRTLVKQTQGHIVNWLSNLAIKCPSPEVESLKLRSPVILMGGEDEERSETEWDLSPEKPCILIGTQDMLLSRSLNRGYGMSRYRWPMHFGLLNNDCLWVMDEVQLMGPGLWTSGQLDWMRHERFKSQVPCWTWWMSATNSGGFLSTPDRIQVPAPSPFPFDADQMPGQLRDAERPCELWKAPCAGEPRAGRAARRSAATPAPEDQFVTELASAVVEMHVPATLTLVVCNTVGVAQELHAAIASLDRKGASVILLTSRFRKGDREQNEKALIDFESARKAGETEAVAGLICVATQVVEAGVDVSACRLWTEIAPWPSLVQRLGRLNRDGKANGIARAFFFEIPAKAEKGKRARYVGPYAADAVARGKSLARALVAACSQHPGITALACLAQLRTNEKIGKEMDAALQPAPEPFPRAIDVHGLFSTEPDLFGGFTDVSRFVRGEDPQADVTVFWREFDAAKPLLLDGPEYDRAEGCAVSIHRFRKFLDKGLGFVWEDRTSTWQKKRGIEFYPGMVVMLPRRAGGYSASKGWTGRSGDCIEVAQPPGPFDEGYKADSLSEHGEWVTLTDHLGDVRREAERIVGDIRLPDPLRRSIVVAAEHHDIGKALTQWQSKLPQPSPDVREQWAKAPYLFAVQPREAAFDMTQVESLLSLARISFRRALAEPRSRLADCFLWHTNKKVRDTANREWLSEIRSIDGVQRAWMVPFRPSLRHEAASALALWHQYFRKRAEFPALTIYLVAAHHGKVRTVLTARTKQGTDVCGVPRDTFELPWSGGRPLDFSCAADGAVGEFSADGATFVYSSPGWTGLVADLLGGWQQRPEQPTLLAIRGATEPAHLGPFTLAYLEALIRCADMRASQNPSRCRDV
jgi:CRISPR-associated endonuclease/helicase Cas3